MRIIGGEARGRRLFTMEGDDTRPTSDRVRESLFNILSRRVPGARVLDLFAGSGALSLEALSRGADSAFLCDQSQAACKIIRRNIELVRAEEKCTVVCADWAAALKRAAGRQFDIVFLDPPYRMTELYIKAPEALAAQNLLSPDAVLVMEHEQSTLAIPEAFELYDERRYGRTKVALARRRGL